MNLVILFSIIFAILAPNVSADSRLSIVSPNELADAFKDEDIGFSTAHYGNVPFGTHLVGNLVLANPIEACEPMESFSTGEYTSKTNIIAVVKRGGCRITVKSRNAQQAGAKVVLIVDDRQAEDIAEWFGHEQGAEDIKVPTIMVVKKVGEKLIEFLQKQQLNSRADDSPIVIVNFPFDPKSNNVRLDFWYSVADVFKSSYLFLKRFRDMMNRNPGTMTFVPHYVTWTSGAGKRQNFQYKDDPDCISGGRYCAPDPDDEGPLTGADVVWEDLRQACIYKASGDLWWRYVAAYGEKCLGEANIRECGTNILKSTATFNDISNINTCIESNFVVPEKENRAFDERLDDHKILSAEKDLQVEYTINSFPVLFINHKPYYGNLHHPNLVLTEVCKNLNTLTNDCKHLLGIPFYTGQPVNHKGRVTFMLVAMLIVAFVIFYCCRRMIKREGKDMSMQVGGMVTRYFALKETKEGGRDDENDG